VHDKENDIIQTQTQRKDMQTVHTVNINNNNICQCRLKLAAHFQGADACTSPEL
jgi:hypothetical protein